MFHKKSESNTYGVIGLGRFGRALATELAIADADLLVIDSDEERVRAFREYTENAFAVKTFDQQNRWRRPESATAMWRSSASARKWTRRFSRCCGW